MLVKFGKVPKLVKSGRFFGHGVDSSRNLRLIDFNEFPKFRFRVRVVHYKAFLLVIRGSK